MAVLAIDDYYSWSRLHVEQSDALAWSMQSANPQDEHKPFIFHSDAKKHCAAKKADRATSLVVTACSNRQSRVLRWSRAVGCGAAACGWRRNEQSMANRSESEATSSEKSSSDKSTESSATDSETESQLPIASLPQKPPRRPITAYAYFIQNNFGPTVKETGMKKPRDVLKRLAEIWKEWPDQLKQPYRDVSMRSLVGSLKRLLQIRLDSFFADARTRH